MKFDQCLFGYDDGHRLLASSLPLGTETSLLTELSDLAPGTIFNQSEGYWTGLPVPAIGRYVLMRTWPAPEMSRPGCVWTHALFLEPAHFELIEDLSVLRAFASRPSGLADKERYREALIVEVESAPNNSEFLDSDVVYQILLSLYNAAPRPIEIDRPGQLDTALFAVWSQQWPKLRRNLRFQTAASKGARSASSIRFDVTAELAHVTAARPSDYAENIPWLEIAALDAERGANGILRPFLWRYGHDVRRQRGSFLPLTQIKVIDIGVKSGAAFSLIKVVTEYFASPDDAQHLKQDLVDGVLVSLAQPQLVEMLLSGASGSNAFPAPTLPGILRLSELWPDRREEMVSLLQTVVEAAGDLAERVFECLIKGPEESLVWLAINGSYKIRKRVVQENPNILLRDWVLDLESFELADLILLVHEQLTGFDALIPRLLARNDPQLASAVFKKFPVEAASQMLLAMEQGGERVTEVWWSNLRDYSDVLLGFEVMSLVSRTCQLYAIAELFDWRMSKNVVDAADFWNMAFSQSVDDLPAQRSDILNCFLIKIALVGGGHGGMVLAEKLFEVIHDQLLRSRLPDSARDILRDLLPDIGWIRAWDVALRFRLAIASAYVRFDWSPLSYAKLSITRKGREMLAEAASTVPGGDSYAHAAGK